MAQDPPDLPRDADSSGRGLGDEEIALLAAAIRTGTLNATKGAFTRRLEAAFARASGAGFAVACASGTAAVHAAVASLGLDSGDEVVTSPVTDMGAIMPILYEGAAPVFCDVDPETCLVTAATIEPRLTPRTRAIVATHLFGLQCEMAPILELARQRDLVVIEDCAQALLAEDALGRAGTLGHFGCFSFQQGKHMTTGEGGMVVTADPERAARLRKHVNKGWGYGELAPDHDFPALNLRMTELQAAVGLAQLEKLPGVVERRRRAAEALRAQLRGVPGIAVPRVRPGARHSYWRFCLQVDPAVVRGGAAALARELGARGVASAPHYIGKPAYRCAVLRDWTMFPVTRIPYERAGRTPEPVPALRGVERALERMLVLPWNEFYTSEHVSYLAAAIRAGLAALAVRVAEAHG